MSKKNLNKYIPLLNFLSKCKNKDLILNILENSRPEFISLLRNIIFNLRFNSTFEIKKLKLRKLLQHKDILAKLCRTKNCKSFNKIISKNTEKSQSGGFWWLIPSLISAVLPSVVDLISHRKKNEFKRA